MRFAESSFLQVIGRQKTPFIAGRLLSATAKDGTPEVVSGEVQLGGVHEISHGLWKGGTQTRAEYTQYRSQARRVQSGGQGWNGVELRPGIYLVMAVRGSAPPFEAASVKEVKTLDDPIVEELLWILAAEEVEQPLQRVELVRQAIFNGTGLISVYGHYAAGPLHRIGRRDAAALELAILPNPSQAEDNRRAAATNLELQLWQFGDPEDLINRDILNAFFEALPDAPELLKGDIADALSRLLFGNAPKDETTAEQYRRKLRQAASIDFEAAVLHILSEQERRSESEAAKDDIRKLASWVRD